MRLSSNSRAARLTVMLIGTAVALSLLAPVAAHALSDEAEFRAAVSAPDVANAMAVA